MTDNPQTTLYFIRHGETPSNAEHIRQGIFIDDYLDTNGIMQVERIIPIIKQLKLDVFIPLICTGPKRARR